jgi:hypothetical protein
MKLAKSSIAVAPFNTSKNGYKMERERGWVYLCAGERERGWVYLCARERERERERGWVYLCARERICARIYYRQEERHMRYEGQERRTKTK